MNYIKLNAYAKINLFLDVLGKRPDNYHELCSVMQTVNLHDVITIQKTEHPGIQIHTDISWLTTGQDNLIYRAAELLLNRFNIKNGIDVFLKKNIPVGAGLGGGSTDCATTLIGLRKMFSLPISDIELLKIGKELGADVPFCLMGGTALARGIGEKIKRLPNHPQVWILLAKPKFSISTANAFSDLQLNSMQSHPDVNEIIKSINEKNLCSMCKNFYNVFETVAEKNHPIISKIKEMMICNGAIGSMMTGSGPTVFGYFTDKQKAIAAMRNFHSGSIYVEKIFLTSVFNLERH